jgi:hypothetical protein
MKGFQDIYQVHQMSRDCIYQLYDMIARLSYVHVTYGSPTKSDLLESDSVKTRKM